MRKNYIIATAGHVDHGKTSLIKALTGKDCDTHPEEKQRGITIHLGFSHIELADGIQAGIVDVPGHKDFIDTMISGINGIDLVLFIVAADEGFMPQSTEHLQILNMLGVKKGLIVLTKCDLVDEETLFYATEEIKEKVHGTFLENAEIVQTSIISGIDIDGLKGKILENIVDGGALIPEAERINAFPTDGFPEAERINAFPTFIARYDVPFRYYPDRFFQVKGFGSVVTGTVLSGSITKNNALYTLPRNHQIKIRKMEAYGTEVSEIYAGQRASLNLVDFDKEDFIKGVMFCELPYHTTALIDVDLTLFNISSHFELWTTVVFHSATIQTQARIHLITKDKLFASETCLAQIHLEKAVPLCIGDKFIIRNTSGMLTLGGGLIIDAFPLHHRRRTAKVKELLNMRVSGDITSLVCSEIAKSMKPISKEQIINRILKKIDFNELSDLPEEYISYGNWFWIKREQDRLEKKIFRYLQVAHKNNPLENNGKLPEEFTSTISDFPESSKQIIINNLLKIMLEKSIIEKREGTFALKTHKVVLSHTDHAKIYWLDQYILNHRMKTPVWSDIKNEAKVREIEEKKLKQMLFYLVGKKRLVHYRGEYLHTFLVNPVREKLINYLMQNPEGITLAEFRDLIDGNRKISLLLLNIFDNEGITTRVQEKRFLISHP